MVVSIQSTKPDRSQATIISVALLTRIGAWAHAALRTLQMARMLSMLSNMSDHQLAQIGISRFEIPKYAEKLMAEE